MYSMYEIRKGVSRMEKWVQDFLYFLQLEKNYSSHTVSNYQQDLQQFQTFLTQEACAFQAVDYPTARNYVTYLYDQQFSRASIARKITAIRSFYNFLLRKEVVGDSPFHLVYLPKKEERLPSFFYEKELSLLFDSIDASSFKGMRDLALLELLYATGIRVSELTTIELKEIDLSYGILLVHGKGKKERYVPFGEYASQALYQYIEKARPYLLRKKQHQRLFVNMRGDPLTDRGVRHILNEVVKKSALTHPIYPHKIRHSFATHLLNQGADIRIVQELLGHENLSTTQVYTHMTTSRLKQIIDTAHPRA